MGIEVAVRLRPEVPLASLPARESYSSVGQSATLIMWRSAVQLCLGLRRVPVPRSGGLAQLARAPALQAGGQRFESVILHFRARFPAPVRSLTCWKQKQVKVEKKTRHFHVVQLKVCPLARPFSVCAAA